MKGVLRNLLLLTSIVLLTFSSFEAKATHAAGAEITYRCLGGDTFELTYKFYRDCGGIPPPTVAQLNSLVGGNRSYISCTATGATKTPSWTATDTNDVTPVCDGQNSECNGGLIPGIAEYVFMDTLVLNPQCNNWTVGVRIAARNTSTNITGGNLYVETTIFSNNRKCNNSPTFTSPPAPYFCIGQQINYSYGAVDADGDSLVFSFENPKTGPTTNSTFRTGYSKLLPIPGITIDFRTGDLSFVGPNITGTFTITVLISEYEKSTGKLLGTVMRDIQVASTTLGCAGNSIPAIAVGGFTNVTGGARKDSTTVITKAGSNLCFEMPFTDGNTGDTLTTSTNAQTALSPGTVTVSQTGVNPANSRVCWNVPVGTTGNYNVSFEARDDNCQINASTSVTTVVEIVGDLTKATISGTKETCFQSSDGILTVDHEGGIGPFAYKWDSAGVRISANTKTITNIPANISYTVTVIDSFDFDSIKSTGFNLAQTLPVSIATSSTTNIGCEGGCTGTINITSVTGGNTTTPGVNGYSYKWSGTMDTTATPTGLCSGTHLVTISDDRNCDTIYSFFISQPPTVEVSIVDSVNVSCKGGSDGSARSSAKIIECGVYGSTAAKCATTSTATVGTGSSVNSFAGMPTPFGTSTGAKQQYLYRASELKAAGFVRGRISALSFDLQNTFVTNFTEYYLSIGCTDSTDLDSGFVNSGFQVYSATTHSFSVADLTSNEPKVTFDQEFEWDGNSNIVVTICFNKSGAFNAQCRYSTTSFNSVAYYTSDTSNACVSDTASFIIKDRPNIKFLYCDPGITYAWNTTPVQTDSAASGLTAGTYRVIASNLAGCQDTATVTITEPPVGLSLSSTKVQDVTCSGGTDGQASVEVVGGSLPYTFTWPTGVNTQVGMDSLAINLSGGVKYRVTVTDNNGCTDTLTVLLTDPDPITFGGSTQTDVLCIGASTGSITVVPAGGTAPYPTFTWSPNVSSTATASNLAAGNYSVTVTDNKGCTNDTTFTITEPTDPITFGSSTQTDVLCKGASTGSITVVPAGGTAPYPTFTWSPNVSSTATASNLAAGNYSVTVTDNNGCSNDTTFTITEPANGITFGSSTQTDVLCRGASTGAITVVPTGGTLPYTTFTWSPNVSSTATASNLAAGNYNVTVTDNSGCTSDTTFTITEPATSTTFGSSTQTDVLCNGASTGAITVVPTGGALPYTTFTWSPNVSSTANASNLAAGNYSVTVTDNSGCTSDTTFTITEPANGITFGSSTQTNVLCRGASTGAITVVPMGGTAPYPTFTWSPNVSSTATASNLAAGNYNVTVTDNNGCSNDTTFTITEPANGITFGSSTQTDVLCKGASTGSITVVPTGGTAPYPTFTWSPNVSSTATASNLAAGNYNVTVTDNNGCSNDTTFTITEPANGTTFGSSTQTDVLCRGASTGAITVVPTGGALPYTTFTWSPNVSSTATASNLAAGNYSVTVTDNSGCTSDTTFTITEPATATTFGSSTQTDVLCRGASTGAITVVPTGGALPYTTFAWSPNVSSTANASNLAAGNYSVTVTDNNGCTSDTTFTITEPANGITFGNSTQTNVLCRGASTGAITVVPTGGTAPYPTFTWSPNVSSTATASNLAAGNYNVTVTDNNGCSNDTTFTITEPAVALSVTLTVTKNVSCAGGSDGKAVAAGAGGTIGTGYVYTWSKGTPILPDSVGGLTAGNLTVTVTDANGCTATDTKSVSQPAGGITTTMSILDSIQCRGDANGRVKVSPVGGAPTYTFNWSSGTGSTADSVRSALAVGKVIVTVTDQLGCTTKDSITLTEPNLALTASFTGKKNPTCVGTGNNGEIQATVNGGVKPYTFTWVGSGSSTGAGDSLRTTMTAGPIEVTVRDARGCEVNIKDTLVSPGSLTVAFTHSIEPLCYGDSTGSVFATPTGGAAPLTYSFTAKTGQVGTKDSIWEKALGGDTISVEITDNLGCKASASIVLGQPDSLTIAVNVLQNVSCISDTNGQVRAVVTGGTRNYTYNWNSIGVAGVADSLRDSIPVGTHTLTITDQNGCVKSQTYDISGPTSPLQATFSTTEATCYNTSDGSATITPTGGTPNYTFTWGAGNGGATSTTSNLMPPGRFQVTVTDQNNCTIIVSDTIEAPDTVKGVFTQVTQPGCGGTSFGSLTVTPSGGVPKNVPPPYTYTWTGGGINGATDSIRINIPIGPVGVVIEDSLGCTSDTIKQNMIAPGAINPQFTVIQNPLCNNDSTGRLIVTPTGGTSPYSFAWSHGASAPIPASDSERVQLPSGVKIIVTVTDGGGCSDTTSITLNNPPLMRVSFTDSTSIACAGGTNGSITATPVNGVPGYTFNWTTGVTTQAGADSIAIGLSGNTFYAVTITDNNGCTAIDSLRLAEPAPLTASFTDSTVVSCFGDANGSLTVTPGGGTGVYTYAWSASNGDPVTTMTGTDSIAINLKGNVAYTVTVTDALAGCSVTTTQTMDEPTAIQVRPLRRFAQCGNNDGRARLIVFGGTPKFPPPAYTITWDSNGTVIGTGAGVTNLYAGIYTYTVVDGNGCTVKDTLSIDNRGAPIAVLDTAIDATCNGVCDGSINISILFSNGTPSFLWSNGDTTEDLKNACAGNYTLEITDTAGCKNFANLSISNDKNLTTTMSTTPLSCGPATVCDGGVKVVAGNGTTPYKYVWNTSVTDTIDSVRNLCAGKYKVTVTDDVGCVKEDSVVLVAPGALSVTSSMDSVTCNGGADGVARVTSVTGGTAPIKYNWSTGVNDTLNIKTGLNAGTYFVTISEGGGCSVIDTIIVLEPTAMNPVFTVVDADCGLSNGSVTVNVTGGNAPYAYNWPIGGSTTINSDNGYASGAYSVLITDAKNCTMNAPFNIGNINGPVVTLDSVKHESCPGACDGAIAVSVAGGNPLYLYEWSPGGAKTEDTSNICPGIYTLTVTDQKNCVTIFTDTVDAATPIVANATVVSHATTKGVCDGVATVNPTGGIGTLTFNWSPSTSVNQTASALCAGTHYVTITDSLGCTGIDSVVITEPTTLNLDSFEVKQPTCNVVPCDGSVFIKVSGGVPPYKYKWDNGDTTQLTSARCPGIVNVTVTDVSGISQVFPFLLTNPTGPNISLQKTDVTCNGANDGVGIGISLMATPVTFFWPALGVTSDTVRGLAPGLYEVRATHLASGCITVDTIRITEPDPIVNSFVQIEPNCSATDGLIVSNVSGGTQPYNYSWLDGSLTPLVPAQTTDSLKNVASGIYNVSITDDNGCVLVARATLNDKNAPVIALDSIRDESCLNKCDGGIFISTTGGAGNNVYSWSPGTNANQDLTNACSGIYTVQVTDAATCSAFYQDTVDAGRALSTTVTLINNAGTQGTCDGSARVTVSGGQLPLQYNWTSLETLDIATALCAGRNYVTVTDNNGCQAIDSIDITEPVTIILTRVDTTKPECGKCDGKMKIYPSGGQAPYTFKWGNGDVTDSTVNRCAGILTVTVTDANLVSETFTLGLSSDGAPALSMVTKNVSCFNACDGSASVVVTGGVLPYTFSWPSLGKTDSIIGPLCKGIYLVEVRDSKGCIAVDSADISEPNQILMNVTTDSADCGVANGQATITAVGGTGPLSYNWSSGQTGTVTSVNNLTAGGYVITVTDSIGCTDSVKFDISNPAGPNVVVDTVVNETCLGSCNGAIFITPSGTPGPYTFDWTPGGANQEDVANLCAGVYTVKVTDAAKCVTVVTDTVKSPEPLNPTITVVNNASAFGKCDGKASISIAKAGVFKYSWSSGDAGDTARMLCAGVNYVTITTDAGCQYIDSVIINQPQKLILTKEDKTEPDCNVCNGKVKITVAGGIPPYTYNWDNGDNNDSTVNRCAGVAFVTVTDSKGYAEIFSIGLSNKLAPKVSVSAVDNKCFGACEGTATAVGSGTLAPYKYTWPTLGKTGATVSGLCTGTHMVEVKDNVGCIATAQAVISEPSKMVVSTDKVLPLCGVPNGIIFTTVSGGTPKQTGYTYLWLDDTKAAITPAQTTSQLVNAAAGKYYVVVADSNSCSDTVGIDLSNKGSKLAIGLDSIKHVSCTNLCDGAIFTTASGKSPAVYQWIPNGEATSSISGLCSGEYTAVVTDTSSCKTTQTFKINAPEPLNIVFSSTTDATCENSNDGSIKALILSTQQLKVNWEGPENFASNKLEVKGLLPGIYKLKVTDENNCISSDSIGIDTTYKFDVIASNDIVVCEGNQPQQLRVSTNAKGFYTTQWYDQNNDVIGKQDTISVVPGVGEVKYLVEIRQDVCTKYDTVSVKRSDSLYANAGLDRTIVAGQKTTLGGDNAAPAGAKVTWAPGESLSATNVLAPTATPTQTTMYKLIVGDIETCFVQDSVEVKIDDRIKINDGFTPNGDGVNDEWNIDVLQDFPNAKVQIFNRWGQLLYESEPYVPWDGTFEGEDVAIGTYYYVIDLKDSSVSESVISGPITVIR